MIEALFNQSSYMATKKMLDMTVLRQEAITSNMANLETPNYKRLDVAPNFQTELNRAIANGDEAQLHALTPTLAVDEKAVSSRGDGNTVQMEEELMKLNQNFLDHSIESQMVTQSLLKMRLAITGRAA
jgi:flagellar basal-body rod protein FlgB